MFTLGALDKKTMFVRYIYLVLVAGTVGFLTWFWPDAVGGGYPGHPGQCLLHPPLQLQEEESQHLPQSHGQPRLLRLSLPQLLREDF